MRHAATLLAALLLGLPSSAIAAPLRDAWFSVTTQGQKIGWLHSSRDTVQEEGRTLIRSREEAHIEMRRFGTPIVVETTHAFWETEDFRPVRFSTRSRLSEVQTEVDGVVEPEGLRLTTRSLGPASTSVVPWDPAALFPAGADDLARRKGWSPGTTYSFRMFSPDLNALDTVTIRSVGVEEIEVGGKMRRLTKIVSTQEVLPGQETFLWLDEAGEEQRIESPVLDFAFERTTKEEALRPAPGGQGEAPDLALDTVIVVDREIPEPRKTVRAAYRFRLERGDFEGLTLEGPGQTSRREADGALVIEIARAAAPSRVEAREAPPADLAAYLEDSPYLQVSDLRVRQIAREAVEGKKNPWDKARAIEKWVGSRLRDKNMDVGFATAAEVARNLEGDCTEHAVLTAALLRAEGIPSRLAVGLLYFDGKFGYHMWAEAWTGRWVPLDATLAGPFVDATHIRLAESAMGSVSPMASFAALNRLMGQLRIEVLSWETEGGRSSRSRSR